jgi:hypothetical protein
MTSEMTDAELQYFIHSVDGLRYGAWYRVISSNHLEVIGVGMLESAEFAGFSPESSARSLLENFVRHQKRLGIPMPCLDDQESDASAERSDLESSKRNDAISREKRRSHR